MVCWWSCNPPFLLARVCLSSVCSRSFLRVYGRRCLWRHGQVPDGSVSRWYGLHAWVGHRHAGVAPCCLLLCRQIAELDRARRSCAALKLPQGLGDMRRLREVAALALEE